MTVISQSNGQHVQVPRCSVFVSVHHISVQVWPVYCHEQTLGPYTRSCGSNSAVSCLFRYGGRKILRLFPEVVDILSCFEQVKTGRWQPCSRRSQTCRYICRKHKYAISAAPQVILREQVCQYYFLSFHLSYARALYFVDIFS